MKRILITILLNFIVLVALPQTNDNEQSNKYNSLITFFLKNFDSTIIYSHTKSNYYIISKEKNSIYFFTYLNPFSNSVLGRTYPGDLPKKFSSESAKFKSLEPDTNVYFIPVIVKPENKINYWITVNAYRLWNIKDDNEIYKGIIRNCDIDDGSTDTFYLITKDKVKQLNYYEPDFYEKCTKPDINRQNAIKSKNSFKKIFKF